MFKQNNLQWCSLCLPHFMLQFDSKSSWDFTLQVVCATRSQRLLHSDWQECNKLQFSECQPLLAMCNAVNDKPACLDDCNHFPEYVSFQPVLYFSDSNL